MTGDPKIKWFTTLTFPFMPELSKNRMWPRARDGHTYLNPDSAKARDGIVLLVRAAVRHWPQAEWPPGKLWLDIFIEKPNRRTDAFNFLDIISDAVQLGTGIDDRNFALWRLDWTICSPAIITIKIGYQVLPGKI